jgi:hypothetical protein
MIYPDEPEVRDARKPFIDAQAALDGVPVERLVGDWTCEWYGTRISRERGSFCLLNSDGPLAARVGDKLRLTYEDPQSGDARAVNVYAVQTIALGESGPNLAITRRAFAALQLLAMERIAVTVEVLS